MIGSSLSRCALLEPLDSSREIHSLYRAPGALDDSTECRCFFRRNDASKRCIGDGVHRREGFANRRDRWQNQTLQSATRPSWKNSVEDQFPGGHVTTNRRLHDRSDDSLAIAREEFAKIGLTSIRAPRRSARWIARLAFAPTAVGALKCGTRHRCYLPSPYVGPACICRAVYRSEVPPAAVAAAGLRR